MGKGKTPCCDHSQVLNRGPWSDEESKILKAFILKNGHRNWRSLPKLAGLMRCGKSCRLRWVNYLRPGLKRGNLTKEEENTIIHLHQTLGNKWSKIASRLGRTDNEIKNVWNTHLKKRLMKRSASSDVTNEAPSVSHSSSSSTSSPGSNNVIKSEKIDEEEELEDILVDDMACGFEVNAPQSLESLFEDRQIPPPISKPEDSTEIHGKADYDELCSRMVEPGLDDYNEWLNYFDNQNF